MARVQNEAGVSKTPPAKARSKAISAPVKPAAAKTQPKAIVSLVEPAPAKARSKAISAPVTPGTSKVGSKATRTPVKTVAAKVGPGPITASAQKDAPVAQAADADAEIKPPGHKKPVTKAKSAEAKPAEPAESAQSKDGPPPAKAAPAKPATSAGTPKVAAKATPAVKTPSASKAKETAAEESGHATTAQATPDKTAPTPHKTGEPVAEPVASATPTVASPKSAEHSAPSVPPATKAPSKAEAKDQEKFLEEQGALLLEELQSYNRQADALKADADQLAAEMEPGESEFSEEGGEGGNLSVERELDLRLSAQARTAAAEIERALAKIAIGTYGICEKCNQPIPRLRLKALPAAPLCVACKSGGLSRR